LTGANAMMFVGREADRAVAIAMFEHLLSAMRRLGEAERRRLKPRKRSLKSFRRSFFLGFISAIHTRYAAAAQNSTTALVVAKSDDENTEFICQHWKVAVERRELGRINHRAYAAGQREGSRINLATSVIDESGGGSGPTQGEHV
jgi:hypothetical protein